MQLLVKILKNSFFGKQIRKDNGENFACKSVNWMMSEYDERVKEYWRISHGYYIVKLIDDARLEDEIKKLKPCNSTLVVLCLIIVKDL